MTTRALLIAGLVSLCGLTAFAAGDTNQKGAAQLVKDLNSASSITLLSIDSPSAATRKKKEFSVFRGYEILGKTTIAKSETEKISSSWANKSAPDTRQNVSSSHIMRW